jgi:phosphoserine phosphatase RsbX
MNVDKGRTSLVSWGAAGAPLEPGTESGDLHVVLPAPTSTLVAAIDGLGHGPEAAAAAREAARLLHLHAEQSPLEIVQRCHQGLRGSRGVVMSLASFDKTTGSLTWLGVGNVEGVLMRARGSDLPDGALIVRGGVLGYQLPQLRAAELPVLEGDTLILSTDGIRGGFANDLDLGGEPELLAESIVTRYAKRSDDALVVVVRYLGLVS